MGVFSSDNKKTTNTNINETAYNTTTQISGGDSDIGQGAFVAANSNIQTTDNSLALSATDNSIKVSDSSVRTSTVSDYSQTDSSIKNTQTDNSNRSVNDSGNSTYTYTSTDGGAFQMVSSAFGKFVDGLTTQNKMVSDIIGLNQKETLASANNIAARSMDAAFAVKQGEVVSSGNMRSIFVGAGILSLVVGGIAYAMKKRGS